MTYKGQRATISSNTSTLVKASALAIDSLIMFQKISNILSIASFILIVSTLVSAFFGYKYLSSEQFKTKMMNQVLEKVQGLMPDILDAEIPDVTGPSMQLPKFK